MRMNHLGEKIFCLLYNKKDFQLVPQVVTLLVHLRPFSFVYSILNLINLTCAAN